MFKLSDSVRFRRSATGLLLIVAPLLQLIAMLVDPGTWGDDRESVSYGDNPALAQLQSVLYHWSWILLPVAIIGVLHVARRRGAVLGHIGGAFSVLGFLALSGMLMIDPVEWYLGQRNTPDQAAKIFDEIFNLPGIVFGFQMPWIFLGPIGAGLVVFALRRAGFAPWWVVGTILLGWWIGFLIPYGPVLIPFWAAPVAGFGYLGVKVLKMTDAEWISYYPSAAPGVTTPDSYAKTTA
ncbi:hypothetical protein Acor_58760 [Acrocarpospora corrugata]|uniref:DUF4386 domain-containing protein n=2 Tax=Acrocarpospora corrugata TaxID=35763 RepID=A0A5M3W6C4_9ACTN|nr:hypothetical protein Acor_58760 [Acrocarpospora corrugata]